MGSRPLTYKTMRDREVRVALRSRLAKDHAEDPETLFVDELALCGVSRVDIAVVNGSLSGYELKSERDDLRRLPTQIVNYSRVLDFATLVVAERHYSHALHIVPDWWGVVVAHPGLDKIALEQARDTCMNPSIDPASLVRLLWREELLAELKHRGLDQGVRSKTWVILADRLVNSTEVAELRRLVRDCLKARKGWRVAP